MFKRCFCGQRAAFISTENLRKYIKCLQVMQYSYVQALFGYLFVEYCDAFSCTMNNNADPCHPFPIWTQPWVKASSLHCTGRAGRCADLVIAGHRHKDFSAAAPTAVLLVPEVYHSSVSNRCS